ncbi:hypothetical protein AGR1B_Cc10004 [Agrobacterium fabacearum S56]|nr:hypothetical protein AGR1B_Cc10004 [Agrobacterium fabacearum S56]
MKAETRYHRDHGSIRTLDRATNGSDHLFGAVSNDNPVSGNAELSTKRITQDHTGRIRIA